MANRNERIEYIRKTQESSKSVGQKTYKVPWRGKALYLPIVRLDTDNLMFSLDNFRTNRQQIEYQDSHQEIADIFADPESEIGQNAQFDILSQMLSESGKEIMKDLRDRGQEEPAIVTWDGFIINGNRRIAAMKLMGNKYADCVILPDSASKDDLYAIEQELQLSQDFKQEYHWVNELRSLSYGLQELDITPEVMAKRLRIDIIDVIALRDCKFLIDDFLKWKGIENRYDYKMLDDSEQAFTELEKYLRKQKDQVKKQEVKLAVFNLVERRPDEGRLYGHIKRLFTNFDEVHSVLVADSRKTQDENENEESTQSPKQEVPTGDTLIDDLLELGKIKEGNAFIYKVKGFEDSEKAPTNTIKIIDAISDVMAENDENKLNESLYIAVDKALKALSGLSLSPNYIKLPETKEKLQNIIRKASKLFEEIDKIT